MTYTVSIAGTIGATTHTVTLTNLDVQIGHRFTNPFFTFATPDVATEYIGKNTKCINIGLNSNTFDFTFKLTDGPGTFNFTTPSTNYEKLVWMASHCKNAKVITISAFSGYGHIENLHVEWLPGKKNLAEGCSMTVILTDNITME